MIQHERAVYFDSTQVSTALKPVITTQTKGAAAAARANTAHARQRIIRRIMVQLIFFL